MTEPEHTTEPRWTLGRRLADAAGDCAAVALVFTVANGLDRWRVSGGELVPLIGAWAIALGIVAVVSLRREAVRGWLGALGVVALWWTWNFVLVRRPLDGASLAYRSALILAVLGAWRLWRARYTDEERGWAEALRVLAIAGVALLAMAPLVTDKFVSGTDARWYAYMLHDFLEQWRRVGPPVFIGQGEFAWNGGVHPFRSAPVYMHVAGLWDWLTFRGLSAVALQHLAAITAAVAGSWLVYAAGVAVAPARRWVVAAVAMFYVMTPACLMPLYAADAYMTYMATGAFALLLLGIVRVFSEKGGWGFVAAGLSLAWMSHPPTALQATLVTGLLLVGHLTFGHSSRRDWVGATGGGALFAALSLYYFVGMSELPRVGTRLQAGSVMQLAGLALGWVAVGQFVIMRRSWKWALLFLPATVLLYWTCRPWFVWLAITGVVALVLCVLARRFFGRDPAEHGTIVLLGAVLTSAAAMHWALSHRLLSVHAYGELTPQWRDLWAANFFRPLTPSVSTTSDLQPGWALWAGWLAAGLAAWRRKATGAQITFAAISLVSLNLLHWPGGVSEFALSFLPADVRDIAALSMALRSMPVFAVLLVAGWIWGVREDVSPWIARAIAVLLALLVGWSGYQMAAFTGCATRATASRAQTENLWRTENVPLDRFVYDLLPMPAYFSHGKMHPAFELRWRSANGAMRYGPAEIVRSIGSAEPRSRSLRAVPFDSAPRWLKIQPGFELAPGERAVLRFDFAEGRTYEGYLIFHSEHGYRSYRLPESGLAEAFGTRPGNARHLVFWNSGDTVEHYQIEFQQGAGDGDHAAAGVFASLEILPCDLSQSLVQQASLFPWQVRTRFDRDGWLETTRVFLSGYRVSIDGREVPAAHMRSSANGSLEVLVPGGEHVIELAYRGTMALRAAGVVSLIAWIGWLLWCLHPVRRLWMGWRRAF